MVVSTPVGGVGKTETEVTSGTVEIHLNTINSQLESSVLLGSSRWSHNLEGIVPSNSAVKSLQIFLTLGVVHSTSHHATDVWVVVGWERDENEVVFTEVLFLRSDGEGDHTDIHNVDEGSGNDDSH